MKTKVRVELWSIQDVVGIIFPATTGVVYMNQTAGTMCDHLEVEGFYVPLGAWSEANDNPFIDLYAQVSGKFGRGIDESEEVMVERARDFLRSLGLERDLEPVMLSQAFTGIVAEAWLPVRVLADGPCAALGSLVGEQGVLTWPNSD